MQQALNAERSKNETRNKKTRNGRWYMISYPHSIFPLPPFPFLFTISTLLNSHYSLSQSQGSPSSSPCSTNVKVLQLLSRYFSATKQSNFSLAMTGPSFQKEASSTLWVSWVPVRNWDRGLRGAGRTLRSLRPQSERERILVRIFLFR